MNLKGKRILIVGATSDIGRAISVSCQKKGAEVLATGRNTAKLGWLQKEGVKTTRLDLLRQDSVMDLIESMPVVNGIVFSVGSVSFSPFSYETFESIQEKTMLGFSAIAALLAKIQRHKKISRNASIVLLSSINGVKVGSVGSSIYSAVKAAVSGLSKSLALEMSVYGVRVNSICPGIIDTPQLHQNFSEEAIRRFTTDYPLKRIGSPIDIANGTIFLLSDDSSWITGTNLIIDGGYSAR